MNAAEILLRVCGLAGVWILLIIFQEMYKRGHNPQTVAKIRRRSILSRLRRRKGVPRLCGYHINLELRSGLMAVHDAHGCERCLEETDTK